MQNLRHINEMLEKRKDNEPHFNVWAMCLPCSHRWIGVVHFETSLFSLECPSCGAQESFASIIPRDYLEAHAVTDEDILERE